MMTMPATGFEQENLFSIMESLKYQDTKWRDGQTFCLVYDGGKEIAEVNKRAYNLFMSENGLNPSAFPSLKTMENEVVSIIAHHLGSTGDVCGTMTSGGTESILMACKAARDWGIQHKKIKGRPQILMPESAHPAFNKAAHYFGLDIVTIPMKAFRADIIAMRQAITEQTAMLVGSAPNYPFGVIDPISDIAQLAQEYNLWCHVDACIGGILLPFFRKLGQDVPLFDFTLPGVTSLSVDLHKYAYAAKGTSVILYKNNDFRRNQFFVATDWPGGIYASPSMTGTRPGGAIASAWAILHFLGEEGYLKLSQTIKQTTEEFVKRIDAIDGVTVVVPPEMSIIALSSDQFDIYQIGDEMGLRGWYMDRQQSPPSLHLTIMAGHAKSVDQFFRDLEAAILSVKTISRKLSNIKIQMKKTFMKSMPQGLVSKMIRNEGQAIRDNHGAIPKRTAAMYGMLSSIQSEGDLIELVLNIMDGIFTQKSTPISKATKDSDKFVERVADVS
ncbi:MAG: aspartate aminotransferase family protein [Bdellovibrio sp.]|nr:aspartate aminotransferase family protein [Bdellovibrio sp.]